MTARHHPDTGAPEVRDELIRKTVDFMTMLQWRLEKNAVDPLIAATQCRALWAVTSGLVGDDISSLLAQQADAIGPRPIKRFFVARGKLLLLAYLPDQAGFILQSISTVDGSRTKLKSSPADAGAREAEIEALVAGLATSGFVAL